MAPVALITPAKCTTSLASSSTTCARRATRTQYVLRRQAGSKTTRLSSGLRTRSRSLRISTKISVSSGQNQPPEEPKDDNKESVALSIDRFLQRYDILSAGVGALCGTSIFVACGRDPWQALGFTCVATVLALCLEEYNTQK